MPSEPETSSDAQKMATLCESWGQELNPIPNIIHPQNISYEIIMGLSKEMSVFQILSVGWRSSEQTYISSDIHLWLTTATLSASDFWPSSIHYQCLRKNLNSLRKTIGQWFSIKGLVQVFGLIRACGKSIMCKLGKNGNGPNTATQPNQKIPF